MTTQSADLFAELNRSAQWKVDRLCTRYEQELLNGTRSGLETLLDEAPAAMRPALMRELLLIEWEHRRASGQPATLEEYVSRFPSCQDTIRQLWSADTIRERGSGSSVATFPMLPGYEILRELGRGGMGVVYCARQRAIDRIVALKMLLDVRGTDSDLARFRTEAAAVARLQHPHIVSLFDFGEHGGRPYFTMEYVAGGTLAHHLAGHPLAALVAAELVAKLADAVAHAHLLGVIHRDLKPANVLLSPKLEPQATASVANVTNVNTINVGSRFSEWTPKITDFGLAKRLDTTDLARTETGHLFGTPSYMAPEQVRGTKDTGTASDVYALGAILYECLTGRPPYRSATPHETFHQICNSEPIAPRRLNSSVSRDIETIALKCLEKEPRRRYPTAAALADDLRRFLTSQPIRARTTPAAARLWKWLRRRPTTAGLVIASVLALVAIPAAVINGLYSTSLASSLAKTQSARERAENAERQVREGAYFHKIMLAGQEWRDAQVGRVRELLAECDPEHRGWEWHYLNRLCTPSTIRLDHPDAVDSVAVSLDGSLIASGSQDHAARIWDANTHALIHTLLGHTDRVYRVAFDPTGRRLATASSDGTVKIWNTTDGRNEFTFAGHTGSVRTAVFSPDSQWVASAGKDGRVKIWNAATGQVRLDLDGMVDGHDHPLVFSPSGEWLAYGSHGPIRIWETASGRLLHTMPWPETITVRDMAVDAFGKRLAVVGGNDRVELWDLPPQPASKPRQFDSRASARAVAWSPDGSAMVSGGIDSAIKLWDPATGTLLDQLRGHEGRIHSLAWMPNRWQLVSASDDRTIRIWDTQSVIGPRRLNAGKTVRSLAWFPDGRRVLASCWPAEVICLDVASGRQQFVTQLAENGRPVACAVSSDSRYAAVGGADMPLTLFDAQSGEILATFDGHASTVQVVQFSPNGRLLASVDRTHVLKLWDVVGRREMGTSAAGGSSDPAWTIGGRSLRSLVHALPSDSQLNYGVAWSPTVRHMASWQARSRVAIWEVDTGNITVSLRGHTHGVNSIAWSPDGHRVATASSDQTVRVWDPSSGQQALVLRGFEQSADAVAWSLDGHRLAAGSHDGSIVIWDGSPTDR